ncbi:MAG: hypothetical protein L3J02_07870, partial [Henriciella sp.]|nr:hypothetical protein [Henriciella sp.]
MVRASFSLKQFAGTAMMVAFVAFALLPIIWAFILSFRPTTHLFEPVWESPTALTFSNFASLLNSEFPKALFNSLITAGSATVLAMLIGVPAGFALA